MYRVATKMSSYEKGSYYEQPVDHAVASHLGWLKAASGARGLSPALFQPPGAL